MFTLGTNGTRFDLKVIASLIEPNAKVLDLGCGEGDLLLFLQTHKNVSGTGIEKNEDNITRCIQKGLSVIQGDINAEVKDYPDQAFDYVILSQTLQQVFEPAELIRTLLNVGKKVIVSFPNFSHWRVRLQLLFTGYAPVTRQLPYEWYNTPNIRVITLKDFRKFARDIGFHIFKEIAINTYQDPTLEGKIIRWFPDLLAEYGIFLIGKGCLFKFRRFHEIKTAEFSETGAGHGGGFESESKVSAICGGSSCRIRFRRGSGRPEHVFAQLHRRLRVQCAGQRRTHRNVDPGD